MVYEGELAGSAVSHGRVSSDKIEEIQVSPQNIFHSFERRHVELAL